MGKNEDTQEEGAESAPPEQQDLCRSSSFSATSCRGDLARPCVMSEREDGVRPTAAPISANVIPFPRKSAMSDTQSVSVAIPPILRNLVADGQRHIVVPFRKTPDMLRNFVYPAPYAPVNNDSPAQAQGKRIKYWRKQKKWTQQDLAKRVNMKPTSIATLEQGKQMNSKGLVKIAAALGISYHHLTTGKDDPHSEVEVVELVSDEISPLPAELAEELGQLEPAERRLAFYRFKDVISEIRALRRGRKQS